MKIAIVHYHLRRGGVTQVIATAVEALRKFGHELVVFSGEKPKPEMEVKFPGLIVVDELKYKSSGSSGLGEKLIAKAGGDVDVWHFHNHALGKNVQMPRLVCDIARTAPVLLQVHDFAEDGRSKNFRRQLDFDSNSPLWPQASQIHYATINGRDLGILRESGVDADRLSLLPNAVSEIKVDATPADRPFAENRELILYPTRAIRRKNIGELLLHAHFNRDSAQFVTTLVPENPDWIVIHNEWQQVVKKLNLPVTLGDHGHEFSDLMGWADSMITTSVAEGFGLAFLEPWLLGKSVVGRNLPDITSDFPVDLSHLYERFDVPVDLISLPQLTSEIRLLLEKSYAAYGRELPTGAVEQALQSIIRDGKADLGRLSEPFQARALENPRGINPPNIQPVSAAKISKQADLVRQHFCVDSYGDKLNALYVKIAQSGIGVIENPGPDCLLDAFLNPARFNLLRT